MKVMKVMIIGSKGMLGSMLCQTFADLDPVCVDKGEIDITSIDSVRDKMSEVQPDIIINAAAYTDVDGAEANRDEAFRVNEDGVRNLATVARDIDATLVHYSTDYVFSGATEEGYMEDDPPGPAVNTYGESKLAGERALKEVGPVFFLIRSAWLYGPNGKNFVNTMLNLAKDHSSLSVVNDQHGSPTFTKDVAEFTKKLIKESYPKGIYHAVNEGMTTWFDFANKIFQLSHAQVDVKPIPTKDYPLPAKRPAFSVLQNTRGPKMRMWEDALDEYIRSLTGRE